MAVSAALPTTFRTPKQRVAQATVFPAPLQGIDARVPLATDNLDTCIWAINMLPTEYSMRVRNGTREWQTNVNSGEEVRTILPFTGSTASGSGDKLFAVTKNGIYDVTTQGGSPTLKVSFSSNTADAGYGTFTQYVDESGDDMMFYADGDNGLFKYDPVADTWAQHTGITEDAAAINTFTMANVNFVMIHKLRIWLIEKDKNFAWYLPIRSAAGSAKEFFFGSKFRHGGELVGLYNWTVDGGYGRDDHLVAVSRGGDVIPYTGEDPADAATWANTGTFFIGTVPKGSRVASEYGGELFVLSKFGITAMSSLLRGATLQDPYANVIGHKIARLLREDLAVNGEEYGWSIQVVSDVGSIMITSPQRNDGSFRQYVYNIATQGWGLWRDVPILSSDSWTGSLMIGTADGDTYRMDQNQDNVTAAGTGGDPITFFLLTSYSHLGSPATFKRAKLARPNFVAVTEPLYAISTHYDYQTDEPTEVSGTPQAGSDSVWDTGLWGTALWSTALNTPYNDILGQSGIGRSVAIALVGSANTQCDLASFDLVWDTGGVL
jgi:hypothetical protein